MELTWCYRRLRCMSAGEVCWRIRRLVWQMYARCIHGRWHALYLSHQSEHAKALELLDAIRFYGLDTFKATDIPAAWAHDAIEAADRLLQHRFRYLSLGEIDLGATVRWNHEYKRHTDTPLIFGPWMDYGDSAAYGDFKYFWELPRLQHLILLAKAYYLTADPRYAEEVLGQLRQFTRESPYLLGVNWTMPMEAGIRLVSLCWVTMFLKSYLHARPADLDSIESAVRANVDFVTSNYARYSSANNHLIGEAAGVFIAGICFRHLKGMRRHRDVAWKVLCTEIQRQHFADGVNKEQALHYQVFGTCFFLLAALLGRANGSDFPVEYWRMLEKSAEFIAAMMDSRTSLLRIGDSDDGRAVVLSSLVNEDAATILATLGTVLHRNAFKQKVREFDEASFWLLGKSGMEAFRQLLDGEKADALPGRFEEGGYTILKGGRSSKLEMIFDCGPLGFGPIAAHGHADALSFTLDIDGRPFFIDPGTYTYDRRSPWRNYFRSTAAHNTVVIDGQDQSEMAGPFLWGYKADAHLESCSDDERQAVVVGWHDGYHRLADPVVHRRSIELNKGASRIRILDELEGRDSHEVCIYFHLAPECEVGVFGGNRLRIQRAGGTIELVVDSALSCEVARGRDDPPAGWASFAYDEKVPVNTVICKGTFCGQGRFETQITAILKDDPSARDLSFASGQAEHV